MRKIILMALVFLVGAFAFMAGLFLLHHWATAGLPDADPARLAGLILTYHPIRGSILDLYGIGSLGALSTWLRVFMDVCREESRKTAK